MQVTTNDKTGLPHASNRNEKLGRHVAKAKGLKVKTNLKAGSRNGSFEIVDFSFGVSNRSTIG
jgi:hypothetical protein